MYSFKNDFWPGSGVTSDTIFKKRKFEVYIAEMASLIRNVKDKTEAFCRLESTLSLSLAVITQYVIIGYQQLPELM